MKTIETGAWVCGVDEAGRGPLCGAVVAAAVILDPVRPIEDLNDSKKLTSRQRERLAILIRERSHAWAVAEASVEEIDRLNILHATMLAMQRAVAALRHKPDRVLVDGNRCPDVPYPCSAIVKGDSSEPAIAAASILAKTVRDEQMVALDVHYPEYGFSRHKGYPTVAHLQAIRRYGVLDCHRTTFGPVRAQLMNPELWGLE